VITDDVDAIIRAICLEISTRYEITFLEVGTNKDHVHFLVQSVPSVSPTRLTTIIKSIVAREVFKRAPAVKQAMWGGHFWSSGYYINSVGPYSTERVVGRYVANQGRAKEYRKLHSQQISLF
jgi:REP element-mobilizing transposase RayT